MAFDVYPASHTSPLNVGASTTSALIAITEQTGPDNVDEPAPPPVAIASLHPDTMFIRVAMLGAIPAIANRPTIVLKANTGDEVEIKIDYPNPMMLPDTHIFSIPLTDTPPPGSEVADGFKFPPDANNVYLIKVLLYHAAPEPPHPWYSWQIRIKNNDVIARDFTWVVAGSLAETRQPWIDAQTATLEFDALTSQTPQLTATIPNKGTGPLNITNPVGSTAGDPKFTVAAPVPGAIDPNHTGDLKIQFAAPAAIGETNANFDIASNDPIATTAAGHNKRIPLHGVSRQLEVVMLLDASGSMGYKPDGSPLVVADSDSRWGKLKEAANQFLNLLGIWGDGKGRFGVAVFPDITVATYPASPAPSPSAGNIVSATPITGASTSAAITTLAPRKAEKDRGFTPIGFGIGFTMGTTSGSFGYFQGTGAPVDPPRDFDKRFLLLMSDGKHNSSPPDPPFFYGTGPTSFKGKKIRVMAVGYGDPAVPTPFEVDHVLLNTIKTESDGEFWDAGLDDAGFGLKKQFRAVISAGLTLDPTSDPTGVLTPGTPEVRHQVTITPYDTKVAFVVNWRKFDERRVNVTLLTPTCELITPATAHTDPNIEFLNHKTYAIYAVNHDYLRNAVDPANPRYGTWRLIISGNLSEQQNEPYDYEVITESRLNLTLTTDSASYFAGDTIRLTAAVTLDGKGITNAVVTVRLTVPGQSSDNWLAGNRISANEFARSKASLAGADVTALGVKASALKDKGIVFANPPHESEIKMTDVAGDGRYTASFPGTTTPGTYDFYVTAIGQTPDGSLFRREKRLNIRVGVRPDAKFTLIETTYRTQTDGNQVTHFADVRVTPRDPFGNVVLIDPAFDSRVQITVKDGEFTNSLTWNLDASYSQTIKYRPGVTPTIGLNVDGRPVVPIQPLAPIGEDLHWADNVIHFRAGGEAARGANQHTDPNAALGDVRQKRPDQFVSLGAGGALTLCVEGQFIKARGDDDVTVFVHSDEDPRPYEVEVLPIGLPVPISLNFGWVSLGVSPGVTQSFGLRQAGIKTAAAVRITDKSGRRRNSAFKPSSTPGVSIAGVGAKKTADFPGGIPAWLLLIKQIIKWVKKQTR